MSGRRVLTVTAIVLGVLLGFSTAALAALRLAHRGEILPGIEVAGVDVGGLSREDAASVLAPVVAARESDTVTLQFGDREFTVAPDEVGFRVDLDDTLDVAMATGRDGGLLESSWAHVRSYWTDGDLELTTSWDADALVGVVGEISAEVDRDPFPGAIEADPQTLAVTASPPQDGAIVRDAETRRVILDGFATPGPVTTALPVDVTPTRIAPEAIEAVAAQARRVLEAPVTLRAPAAEATVTLAPTDLARMIGLREIAEGDGWTVELEAPVEAVETAFADDAGRFEVEPIPARIEAPRAPSVRLDDKNDVTWKPVDVDVTIVPSTPGQTFDPELAAAQLEEMFRDGIREAELRLATVEPDFTTEDAEALGITELISTFTTYHACCQARVNNIQRLADMVDGTIVEPGEQFSINQISGERTCTKGFKPAGMILRGEIVDVCGGGVSQFGTTTVNAIFFAGLTPDAYKPHSFYISRYPMGREATLNYPSPDIDVRFTNDTGNGILVRTSYTSTSITVSFYGSTDVASVEAVHGSPYNSKPYRTEYRENKDLPPGASNVLQSGRNGFSVKVSRVIRYDDGTEERDDWSNVYVPEREIIERNTTPPPPPPPAPKPSPAPSPRPPAPSPPPPGGGGGGDADG